MKRRLVIVSDPKIDPSKWNVPEWSREYGLEEKNIFNGPRDSYELFLDHPGLTLKAKGLYFYLQSFGRWSGMPSDEPITVDQIRKHCIEGPQLILNALEELEYFRLVVRKGKGWKAKGL
jgi:hypothetical protein